MTSHQNSSSNSTTIQKTVWPEPAETTNQASRNTGAVHSDIWVLRLSFSDRRLGCLCGYELMNWARLGKCWPRSLCSLYLLWEAALQSTGCAFSSSQSDPLKDPSRRWPAGQYFKA